MSEDVLAPDSLPVRCQRRIVVGERRDRECLNCGHMMELHPGANSNANSACLHCVAEHVESLLTRSGVSMS